MQAAGNAAQLNWAVCLIWCLHKFSNKVDVLLKIVFSQLPFNEKINIKNEGRPVPNLNIIQTSKSPKHE